MVHKSQGQLLAELLAGLGIVRAVCGLSYDGANRSYAQRALCERRVLYDISAVGCSGSGYDLDCFPEVLTSTPGSRTI